MKTKIILSVLLCVSFMLLAAGEYRRYGDTKQITVVTDSAGDSTYASGNFGVGMVYGFNTLHGRVIMENAKPNPAGLGNADSAWLWLYTYMINGDLILVDSAVKNALPCTLTTVVHSNVGDTLLRSYLQIAYAVYDSLGDTLATVEYPIKYDITLK